MLKVLHGTLDADKELKKKTELKLNLIIARPILTQISANLFMLDLTVIKRVTLCTWYYFQHFWDKLFISKLSFEAYLKEYYKPSSRRWNKTCYSRVFQKKWLYFHSHDVISSHSSYCIQSRTQIHVLYSKLSSMHCFTERKPIICSAHLTRLLSWTSEINAYNIAMKWVYMNTNTGLEASATRST